MNAKQEQQVADWQQKYEGASRASQPPITWARLMVLKNMADDNIWPDGTFSDFECSVFCWLKNGAGSF